MIVNDENILQLGKYVAAQCIEANERISNLQLQLITFDIIKDIAPECLVYLEKDLRPWGYRFPVIYDEYCCYGGIPIWYKKPYDLSSFNLSPEEKDTMDNLIKEERKLSSYTLVNRIR